tara:strand:- start:1011 stop:1682 length:672 start_codon:yes stop_codon:yes gene_type:complete
MSSELPPGQIAIDGFPRFGLTDYAARYSPDIPPMEIKIYGDVENSFSLTANDLVPLARRDQRSDFHCVTTWTSRDLAWSGVRFRDFYENIVVPKASPRDGATHVVFRSHYGFRARLPLEDLLADDVLLADSLQGQPLCPVHGAPLRLIAPAHYGYKSIKQIKAIEFWTDNTHFRPPALKFMDHPRARVAFEERGLWFPGWLLRYLYRPLVRKTIRLFERTVKE